MNPQDLDLILKLSFDLSRQELDLYLKVMRNVMAPRRFNDIARAVEEIRGRLESP